MSIQRPTLVGISHGTASPAGQQAIAELLRAVREASPGLQVIDGFVDVQHPNIAESLALVPHDRDAVVVPLLLSAGYHVYFDLTEGLRDAPVPAVLASALGPDPRLAALLHERLVSAGYRAGDAVIMVAAGSSDERAAADCRVVGELLEVTLGQPVTVAFLAAAQPRLGEAIAATRAEHPMGRIAISSYLLAPGYFQSLVEKSDADIISEPLLRAAAPAPEALVRLVIDRYDAAFG